MYCTTIPKKKAIATERNIASMTVNALSVLSSSPSCNAPPEPAILTMAMATVPPRSSNTKETVVEVGMPSELNTSKRTTSVSITASSMHIISEK